MADVISRTDSLMASLGLEVYRVGGSVRDEIMGRKPKDADYVVCAITLKDFEGHLIDHGHKFKPLVDRNGRQLGMRLLRGGVEVTLPRKEISTGPKHGDFDIVLDPGLGIADDAMRRDFTFNALYRHIEHDGSPGEVADPTGYGLHDLQHRFIRTTHPDSFRDDPLRTLRALRFMSTLGYDLATNTEDEMIFHASAVDGLVESGHLSGTVYDEFCKMLMGEKPDVALRVAAKTDVLGFVFPELDGMVGFEQGSKYHDLTTDEHTFKALATAAHVDAPLRVRWALLFHDAGKPDTAWRGKDGRLHYYRRPSWSDNDPMVNPYDGHIEMDHQEQSEYLWRKAAERMNVPRAVREDVAFLIREHMVSCESKIKRTKVHRERVRMGDEMLSDLYLHRMCDLTGKGKANQQHMLNIAAAEKLRQEAARFKVPKSVKDLAINGDDAKLKGFMGSGIGFALRVVLDEVVCDPSSLKLSREWQLERLGGG